MIVGYLADKSAIARLRQPLVLDRLTPLIEAGLVATCPIVDLEVLYSARSPADYEAIRAERFGLMTYPITAEVTDRALEVQRLLARRGQHRLPIPDLLIAAAAELNDLAVIHYDADFDRIAEVTRQPTEWIVPRGTV